MAQAPGMVEVERETATQFRALFSAEFTWVWTTLRRMGVPPRDLEDVTHDVFLHVHRKLHAYDPARPVRPWLFAFAYRTASDYRRLARNREQPTGEVPDVVAREPRADELLEHAEERDLVHAALEAVELDRRAVLIAFDMDGTPMKEIAEALGIPLNTAYSRLRLAREEFTASVRRLQTRRAHVVPGRRGTT